MKPLIYLAAFATLATGALVATSCGPAKKQCGPSNCSNGCCDATGTCQLGTLDLTCGTAGNLCISCQATELCQGGTCLPFFMGKRDAGTPPPDGGNCKAAGSSCLGANECCTQFCSAVGVCAAPPDGGQCTSNGGACASGATCCSSTCSNGACAPADGGSCKANSVACATSIECCSNTCSSGVCVAASMCGPGTCSGCCSNGVCQAGISTAACGYAGATCTSCSSGEVCAPTNGGGSCQPGSTDGGSCMDPCTAHPGIPSSASCGTCEQSVCSSDSFCCMNEWDSMCATAAQTKCAQCMTDAG